MSVTLEQKSETMVDRLFKTSSNINQNNIYVTNIDYLHRTMRLTLIFHKIFSKYDTFICLSPKSQFIGQVFSIAFNKPFEVLNSEKFVEEKLKEAEIAKQIAEMGLKDGKKILLLDNVAESPEASDLVRKTILLQYPDAEISTAVLWNKASKQFRLHFHVPPLLSQHVVIHLPIDTENYCINYKNVTQPSKL